MAKTITDKLFTQPVEFAPDAGATMLKKEWAQGLDVEGHGRSTGDRKRSIYAKKEPRTLIDRMR